MPFVGSSIKNMIVEKKDGRTFFWLTRAESEDEKIHKQIDDYCEKYSKKEDDVIVFMSGKEDFIENTVQLLLHQIRDQTTQEIDGKKSKSK